MIFKLQVLLKHLWWRLFYRVLQENKPDEVIPFKHNIEIFHPVFNCSTEFPIDLKLEIDYLPNCNFELTFLVGSIGQKLDCFWPFTDNKTGTTPTLTNYGENKRQKLQIEIENEEIPPGTNNHNPNRVAISQKSETCVNNTTKNCCRPRDVNVRTLDTRPPLFLIEP